MVSILLIVLPIISIIISSIALTKKTHGLILTAGIVGLIFGGLLGGILTLVGMNDSKF
jgi:hypothetical protein